MPHSTSILRPKSSPLRRSSLMSSVEELAKSLHEAAFLGDRKKVKKILLCGMNVDIPSETGSTALFMACSEGHEGLADLLLRYGANPNQRNLDGDTSLHAVASIGNARMLSMLVDAGGDLRLHNRRGLTARDLALKLLDSKKRKNVLDFIEKRRNTALNQCGTDILNLSLQSHRSTGSKSLGSIMRPQRKSAIGSTSIHSDGFGQICIEKGTFVGSMATVPMAREGSMKHDVYGYTYNNGPFMVMESMLWNKEPVTLKRLHKEPQEGGHVDMLITEFGYMSRLSHPSILLLMGACRINNLEGLVLIYERVALGSLFCCLYQKFERFSRVSMSIILQQTANALLYLHRQNLYHCYISSHSIQLIKPDFAKLSNFEYMVEGGSAAHSSILENKYINAAYNWLAPEILAGQSPTEKSDLYSLSAVLWEFVNGQMPWFNVPASTIVQELVERGHVLELDDHVEDPFNMLLQYGLSLIPDERRLSLEQMRDFLLEYIDDQKRLDKAVKLEKTSHPAGRNGRHARFSPEVEIASISSEEGSGLSMEDIEEALENLSPQASPVCQTALECEVPSLELKNKDGSNSKDTNSNKEMASFQGDSTFVCTPGGASQPLEAKLLNRALNKDETFVKTVDSASSTHDFTSKFPRLPLQQSTPVIHADITATPSVISEDRPVPLLEMNGVMRKNADTTSRSLPTSPCQKGDETKIGNSRVSFDFIQNPLKKAFFEGTVSPSPYSSVSIYSPKKEVVSKSTAIPVKPMSNGIAEKDLKSKKNLQTSKCEVDKHPFAKFPADDPYVLELQRETEEFISSSTIKSQQHAKTKFVKHTYGYYSNNVYRSKCNTRSVPFQYTAGCNSNAVPDASNKSSSFKGSNSTNFGVSLKELKVAMNQKLTQNPDVKESQATNESESISFGSMISQQSQMSVTEPGLSASSSQSFKFAENSESCNLKKPCLTMATVHQHLSFAASLKSSPKYSQGICLTKAPFHHAKMTLAEDEEEKAMISSNFNAKSVSKDVAKPFDNQLFTPVERSTQVNSYEHSGTSLSSRSRIFDMKNEIPVSEIESEEQMLVRSVKPASHHEPCLLKPSKVLLLGSPLQAATADSSLKLRHSAGYTTQQSLEKGQLPLTLQSKSLTPYMDKRLESLKSEMDAMPRFKSDSILQNKADRTVLLHSSPQTMTPNGISSQQTKETAGFEVKIKDLISTFQTRMEEHKHKQSILTLKKNPPGGDSLSVPTSENKLVWLKDKAPTSLMTPPAIVPLLQCLMNSKIKLEPSTALSASKVEQSRDTIDRGAKGEDVCREVFSVKEPVKVDMTPKDICVSKLQLSLTSPAVAKMKLLKEDNVSKEVSELVNAAILKSHEQVLEKYVHQECPHKTFDTTVLRANLGVTDAVNKSEETVIVPGRSTRLSMRSGASDCSAPSSASYTIPKFRSIATNTYAREPQETSVIKGQISPVGSLASSHLSSVDIKEFYYDDELNSSELATEKHLTLQSTADFDSSENIQFATPAMKNHPLFNYSYGASRSGGSDGGIGESKAVNGKREVLRRDSLVAVAENGTPKNMIRDLLNGNESGAETDTDSTMSSMAEALCVTKHINTSPNDGYASSVTVESHAKGYHMITCNRMDPLTGNSSTMYKAKVKAPRVITKFILDNGDSSFPR